MNFRKSLGCAALLLSAGSAAWAQEALEILLREPSQMVAAEYFVDRDPGAGLANPVELPEASEVVDLELSTGELKLSPGGHAFYIRWQDQYGHWGHPTRYPFFVMPYGFQQATQIRGGEYFINQDPGLGLGTPFLTEGETAIRVETEVSLTGLKPGGHDLYFRLQDSRGEWLASVRRSVFVGPGLHATGIAWRVGNSEMTLDEGQAAVTEFGIDLAVARAMTGALVSEVLEEEWLLETQIILNGGIPWVTAGVPFVLSETAPPPPPLPPLPTLPPVGEPVEVEVTLEAPRVVALGVGLTLGLGAPIEQAVQVEQSADLRTWFPLGVIEPGETEMVVSVEAGNRYFRLVPVGTDEPGLPPLPRTP